MRGNFERPGDAVDFQPVCRNAQIPQKRTGFFGRMPAIRRAERKTPAAVKAGQEALATKGGVVLHASIIPGNLRMTRSCRGLASFAGRL